MARLPVPSSDPRERRTRLTGWRTRIALGLLIIIAVATVVVTNHLLTERFTQTTRNRAEDAALRFIRAILSANCGAMPSCRSFWRAIRR